MSERLMEQPEDPLHEVRVCEGELRNALLDLSDAMGNPAIEWGDPGETVESALVRRAARWIRYMRESRTRQLDILSMQLEAIREQVNEEQQ